jgi:basic membrane lipoprotein Med (substrate-binding protein (PBP1-ABC) superfamily)
MNTDSKIHKTVLGWRGIGSFILALALLALASGAFANVSAAQKGIPVGLVFDYGVSPYNDISFQGLMRAEKDLGIVESVYIPVDGNYASAIQQCVDEGNALCISIGFMSTAPMEAAAMANPGVDFAIVDGIGNTELFNLRSIWFDVRQAGYLVGIVAGKMTTSNKLGVVAGMDIQPVKDFAEGFRNAAQCNNPNVEVWIEYTGDFGNPALGAYWAEEMVNLGADMIFNVAGATGNGAIIRAAELGAYAVGVDTDQYVTLFLHEGFPNNDLVLTSAMKNVDVAVYDTIEDYLKGRFTSGVKMYDVGNDGIGIAPFHEQSENVPLTVVQLVKVTQTKIANGEIDLYNECR